MKKTIIIVIVFVSILLVSALLAPLIYQFTDFKFHRILSRCIMIGVILATLGYIRMLDHATIRSVFKRYGLQWNKQTSLHSIGEGFACAFGVLCILMAIEVALGARIVRLNIKDTFILQLLEYIFADGIDNAGAIRSECR